ncbi:MAG: tRNA (guanosine(37)-N1)-methyltransferase TrmD [Verrucomicrobiales bacterium]
MEIDVLTLFPEMVRVPLSQSIIGRALEEGKATLRVHDLRQWSTDKHHRVDDEPFGGGPGMVMTCEPFFRAVEALRHPDSRVVLMTPQGRRLTQAGVQEMSRVAHLLVLCGHYEGIDHRVVESLVTDEISIGDYVLTNGAIAAVVLLDAVIRLLPGVLGDAQSAVEESFSHPGRLEAPCYTRPADFRGLKVPDVLLSGHHAKVADWRRTQADARTRANRPDLLEKPPETIP